MAGRHVHQQRDGAVLADGDLERRVVMARHVAQHRGQVPVFEQHPRALLVTYAHQPRFELAHRRVRICREVLDELDHARLVEPRLDRETEVVQQPRHEGFAPVASRSEPRQCFGGNGGAHAVPHHGREVEHGALAAALQAAIHAARGSDAAHRVDAQHHERPFDRGDAAGQTVEGGIRNAQHARREARFAVDERGEILRLHAQIAQRREQIRAARVAQLQHADRRRGPQDFVFGHRFAHRDAS